MLLFRDDFRIGLVISLGELYWPEAKPIQLPKY